LNRIINGIGFYLIELQRKIFKFKNEIEKEKWNGKDQKSIKLRRIEKLIRYHGFGYLISYTYYWI